MPQEGVATLPPAGAGRFADWIWPSRHTALGSAGGVDTSCNSRHGPTSVQGTSVGIGGGGPPVLATVRNGVACVTIPCGPGAAGTLYRHQDPMGMFFRTSRANVSPTDDDQACYRIIWLFCGSGLAVNAGQDFGLEICRIGAAGLGRINAGGDDGFGIRIQDANILQWLVRGPNGFLTQNITAAPFDTTAWHSVDLRITSATATADATLELRLDDAVVNLGTANTSWAAGTNLPPAAILAAQVGFMPVQCSVAGNNNALFTHQLRMIAAPSVLMTL
jgi:hypothetical protein